MGLAAMMANIMSQDKIFAGDKQRSGMAFNPDYKPARDRKELRKFRIKGEEVESGTIRSPYTGELYHENSYT